MLELVTALKTQLAERLPAGVVPFVMLGLGAVAILVVVWILDIIFKIIKIAVVTGMAIGVIYVLLNS